MERFIVRNCVFTPVAGHVITHKIDLVSDFLLVNDRFELLQECLPAAYLLIRIDLDY